MNTAYRACWASRKHAEKLKRKPLPVRAVILEAFNGYIVVEPEGAGLADGPGLSPEEAAYELTPIWYIGPKVKLREARRLLGLDIEAAVPV